MHCSQLGDQIFDEMGVAFILGPLPAPALFQHRGQSCLGSHYDMALRPLVPLAPAEPLVTQTIQHIVHPLSGNT